MRSERVGILAASAILFASCGWLTAQQPPLLTPGQRVRVSIRSVGVENQPATINALSGDSITLSVDRPPDLASLLVKRRTQLAVPLDSLTSLEFAAGSRSHAALGAGLGAVIGAVAAALAYTPPHRDPCFMCFNDLNDYSKAMALGGVAGCATGAVIGSLIHSTNWEPFPLDSLRRLRIAIAPLRAGRAGIGVSLAF